MELSELKKLEEEARSAAQSVQAQVQDVRSSLAGASDELSKLGTLHEGTTAAASSHPWEGADGWRSHAFSRRYRPGPSVDQLAEEVERLRRQLAAPGAPGGQKTKYARRARSSRPRIYR
jgi:sec-independent protein translocase protein TatB